MLEQGGVRAFARFDWLAEVVFDNLGVRWMFVWEFVRQTKRKIDDAKSTTESR